MLIAGFLLPCAGCLSGSFPVDAARIVRLATDGPASGGLSTRTWLSETHHRLAPLLPVADHPALVTDELLAPDGGPRNLCRYFGIEPSMQHMLIANTMGLIHTAEATIDAPLGDATPVWPGFEDIWIPVDSDLSLSARIGYSQQNGRVRRADCIIVLPGILADKNVPRTRDLCEALRASGYHVVALDLRGHGQTWRRYPDKCYTYGVLEAGELLAVAEWLQNQPNIRHTGLMGFCWGAQLALLSVWEDGRGNDLRDVSPIVASRLHAHDGRRHFEAGVIAFSPPLNYERILDQTRGREWSSLENPVLAGLQERIRDREKELGFNRTTGDLFRLISEEGKRSDFNTPAEVADGQAYLRLMPYHGHNVSNKLDHARVPVLIVHAANDPLCPVQDVANFIARIQNPSVAALVLPGGGHDGFAPYASAYYYSLVFNFYDPGLGAAANLSRRQSAVAAAKSPLRSGAAPNEPMQ